MAYSRVMDGAGPPGNWHCRNVRTSGKYKGMVCCGKTYGHEFCSQCQRKLDKQKLQALTVPPRKTKP